MATFINVNDEYVNAAAVVSYWRPERSWNDVMFRLSDGTERTISNPSDISDRPDTLQELLAAVGAPERDRARVITFINGKIDIRHLG